ncbi:ParA family protein [Halopenitus sp. POP-27]|uniref:ParA family protein n=1 Tax=Halopenitus sp. POP-27 TaxID=2994425 RepID=UPI002468B31C|nr:ParA family protein [Halopenitus sp. POP-27]
MDGSTLALVGATGGAGTTRTAVEMAAAGAIDDRDVIVIDAAYATQGLSEYVSGRIDPDVTTLVTDGRTDTPDAAAYTVDGDWGGRVRLVPASAPFERIARAKTVDAARGLVSVINAASETADHVIVDTPPVAANQAVAAVTETDRIAAVTPGTVHGRDALERLRGRIQDVGERVETTIATRGSLPAADVDLPTAEETATTHPTVRPTGGAYAEGIATALEVCFETTLTAGFEGANVLNRFR